MILGLLLVSQVVQHPACQPDWYDRSQVERALAVESSSRTIDRVSIVIGDCEIAPNTVSIRISLRQLTTLRVLSLADVPAGFRNRTLALAIVELATHPDPEKDPAVTVIKPKKPTVVRSPEPQSQERDFWLAGMASLRVLTEHGDTLLGGRLRATHLLSSMPVYVSLDVGGASGQSRAALGVVDLALVTSGVAFGAASRLSTLALSLGPRFEIGWGRVSGQANEGVVGAFVGSGEALVLCASLETRASVRITDAWWASLNVELGIVVRGIEATANQTAIAGMEGIYTAVRLGVTRGF